MRGLTYDPCRLGYCGGVPLRAVTRTDPLHVSRRSVYGFYPTGSAPDSLGRRAPPGSLADYASPLDILLRGVVSGISPCVRARWGAPVPARSLPCRHPPACYRRVWVGQGSDGLCSSVETAALLTAALCASEVIVAE